jgi:hypothetical protein
MKVNLFLDIETIPDQRPGALDAFVADVQENFRAPSGLTKEQAAKDLGMTDASEIKFTSKDAMIARWEERFRAEKAIEVAEANWRKTSFDGGAGQVVCIGFALDGSPATAYFGMDETKLLQDFFCWLTDIRSIHDRPVFIGHNHAAFDLRFLFHRAVINGVKPPIWLPNNARPWDDCIYDTMVQWAGHGNRISMDNLCKALGIPGKPDDIDGSRVWDFVRDGRIDEVAEYCRGDVQRTREIYKRMTFQ